MIYLWHNSTSGRYELGDDFTYTLERAINEVNLVHEFSEEEAKCAEKVQTNLNRAAEIQLALVGL